MAFVIVLISAQFSTESPSKGHFFTKTGLWLKCANLGDAKLSIAQSIMNIIKAMMI